MNIQLFTLAGITGFQSLKSGVGDNVTHFAFEQLAEYGYGTGPNQINAIHQQTYTLAAAITTLELIGGILSDAGSAISFSALKLIIVRNRHASSVMQISGDWMLSYVGQTSAAHVIGPGGIHFASRPIDGWSVTNTPAADTLRLDPGAATIICDLLLGGIA